MPTTRNRTQLWCPKRIIVLVGSMAAPISRIWNSRFQPVVVGQEFMSRGQTVLLTHSDTKVSRQFCGNYARD